ncbi:hypothetical protein RMN57_28245 [Kitasatospora sp. CM 4170]|uniref:Uncharacterized protein n=1 Tax=Kitasatospora aburaviensis TaxID=67265 RepID=A0ABW1F917_9ACTN|nr:hypothetical protein [Kitasatospora sp. CM 4170]WNM48296.1 hypothetical protein RMN57_28245 [Kitasatospora sp. CM 4170]
MAAISDAERLADAAACYPDMLDDDTFAWLTNAVFEVLVQLLWCDYSV